MDRKLLHKIKEINLAQEHFIPNMPEPLVNSLKLDG